MNGPRRLWTGPCGSAMIEQVARRCGEASGRTIQIVPGAGLARWLGRAQAQGPGVLGEPWIWTWRHLARELTLRVEGRHPPVVGPEAGRVLVERALAAAIDGGEADAIAEFQAWPGYRDRLIARIGRWSRASMDGASEDDDDPSASAIDRAERAVDRAYRELLTQCGGVDLEGLVPWLAECVRGRTGAALPRCELLVLIDPIGLDGRERLLVGALARQADEVLAVLHSAREQPECFAQAAAARQWLLEDGFAEEVHERDASRPAGLNAIERDLFVPGPQATRASGAAGLSIAGVPEGLGEAATIAWLVREQLATGAYPSQVAVLLNDWGDEAAVERLLNTFREWGIPAWCDRPLRVDRDHAVSILLQTLELPLSQWETRSLVNWLRNGRIAPRWEAVSRLADRARCAALLSKLRVYRDPAALANRLEALLEGSPEAAARGRGAIDRRTIEESLALVRCLRRLLAPLEGSRSWLELVDGLEVLRRELGLDDEPDPLWEALLEALDERALGLELAGELGEALPFAVFVAELRGLCGRVRVEPAPPSAPSVLVTTAARAVGVPIPHVILGSFTEGTFPSRAALERQPGTGQIEESAAALNRAYHAEEGRFLRLIGQARRTLALVYPCRDTRNAPIPPAGFLDDVERWLQPNRAEPLRAEMTWLEVILPESLCQSQRERRVRAVGQLGRIGPSSSLEAYAVLRDLAAEPRHASILRGTAEALRTAWTRLKPRAYGRYEGVLRGESARALLARRFPANAIYSASQLEQWVRCPFQYFVSRVLRIEPPCDQDELEIALDEQGTEVHDALQAIHETLGPVALVADPDLQARLDTQIEHMLAVTREGTASLPPLERTLAELQLGQLRATLSSYGAQLKEYLDSQGGAAIEVLALETGFGQGGQAGPLVLQAGSQTVRLSGRIDRIDRVQTENGPALRVIDYKTRKGRTPREIAQGVALQLPLYLMALRESPLGEPLEAGYWLLGENGYKPIQRVDDAPLGPRKTSVAWSRLEPALPRYLGELVAEITRGHYPVRPGVKNACGNCRERPICRITERTSYLEHKPLPIVPVLLATEGGEDE